MSKSSAPIDDIPDAPPPMAPPESVFAHLLQMIEGMARGFAHLADTVPQASGLAALVRTMKTDAVKLREMVAPVAPAPEPDPEPEPAPHDPADHSADQLNAAELDKIEAKGDEKAEQYAKSKR